MKTTTRNTCQRCGTKMHHLIDFGSNEDGTINTEYCHECYVGGVLVERGVSLEEKIERSISSAANKDATKKETLSSRKSFSKSRRYKEPSAVE